MFSNEELAYLSNSLCDLQRLLDRLKILFLTYAIGLPSGKPLRHAAEKASLTIHSPDEFGFGRLSSAAGLADREGSHFRASEIPIEKLNLSIRATKALQKAKLLTVEQIVDFGFDRLHIFRNMGVMTIKEIETAIKHALANDEEPLQAENEASV